MDGLFLQIVLIEAGRQIRYYDDVVIIILLWQAAGRVARSLGGAWHFEFAKKLFID
jgi:hypothetical protein